MRIAFVMDPVSTVVVDEDTTFALMLAAASRGHEVLFTRVEDVHLDRGVLRAHLRPASPQRVPEDPIPLGPPTTTDLAEVDAVFIRKDPPFDPPYLWLTLMLEHLRGRTVVVNDPRGLREANEKVYATWFPEVMPETLVASDRATIRRFVDEVGGQAVIKPVDGHGGAGVFALRAGDGNLNGLIDAVTGSGRHVAMVQRFLPEVSRGDKRILLVDGRPLGAINRVAQGGDLRSNIHVGGRVEPAELTPGDQRIVDAVGPRLAADGLMFVGLDVIAERLTEVNVTSPTGIQQMSRFAGRDLSQEVIAALESRRTA
jgi:glutathione synthase